MKWICKRDFNRVPALAKIKIIDACKGATVEAPHPNHIQRGGIFEFGPWADEKELQKAPASPEKQLIAQLRVCGCISDAADAECVAKIEQELADAKKREASAARLNDRAAQMALQNSFLELIQRASAMPKNEARA